MRRTEMRSLSGIPWLAASVAVLLVGSTAAVLAAESPMPGETPDSTAALGPGELGPGPALTIEWIGQGNPAHAQHVQVDAPWLLERVPEATSGRVTINLTTRDERGLQGPELVRLLRQ